MGKICLVLCCFSTSEGGLPKNPLKEDCGPDIAHVRFIIIKGNLPTKNVVWDAVPFPFLMFGWKGGYRMIMVLWVFADFVVTVVVWLFIIFFFFFLKTKEERRNDDDEHTNFRFGFCAWREETNGRKIAPINPVTFTTWCSLDSRWIVFYVACTFQRTSTWNGDLINRFNGL